jgi:molecular chaperone DnaK
MKEEAEQFADEDRKRKELVEARNNADNMAYQAEKAMEELGDKVPEEIKTQVNDKVAEVRTVLEDQNADAATLKRVTEELSEVVQQIGAAAYQQAGQPGAGGPEGYAPPPPEGQTGTSDDGDEDVVEGEFKDA